MTKEDKQIIKKATKENWRIGDRTRLKRLLKKNLELYRENIEIEKENAELKELKKKKEEIEIMTNFCKTCKKMHTDQLTKAKEIIKNCICIINRLSPTTALLDKNERSLLEQAEQFLKEIEK